MYLQLESYVYTMDPTTLIMVYIPKIYLEHITVMYSNSKSETGNVNSYYYSVSLAVDAQL
jgi:hypothetical protein